jgi:hypothetical protein
VKPRVKAALVAITILPVLAWAGVVQPQNIPTLGGVGMVVLGLALMGGGVIVLRRKNR